MHDANMPEADLIHVEIAYADPRRQILLKVEVAASSTVGDAIRASAILDKLLPDFHADVIGIFGRIVAETARLRDGDRIELYRPLLADPKDSRRRRAKIKPQL